MKIGKRKARKIEILSVFDEVFKTHTHDRFYRIPSTSPAEPFYSHPPEEWGEDETALFDLMTEIEHRLKTEIMEILEK